MNEGMSTILSSIRHADLIIDQGTGYKFIQVFDAESNHKILYLPNTHDLLEFLPQNLRTDSVTLLSSRTPSLLLDNSKPFTESLYPSFLPYQYIHRSLEGYQMSIHFTISRELNAYLEQHVSGFEVKHEVELFADYWKNRTTVLFAGFTATNVSLFIKSPSHGVVYDQVNYQTADDVLYFLLYFAKNLNIDHSQEKLFVTGDITLDSALCRNLSIYFNGMEYISMLPIELGIY